MNVTWISPSDFKSARRVKTGGFVLCKKFYHKMYEEGKDAIPNEGIDGNWEIFNVSHEAGDRVWGSPLEGLGLAECMIMKSDIREFNYNELVFWKNATLGMYGSNSGNLSYLFNVSVNVFDATHYEDGEECNEPIGFADGYCNGPFHKFKGWDYTELLWKWNMPERGDYDDFNRESPNIELIKFFIKRILYREYGKRLTYFDKRVIKDLRLHVKALSKVPTGYENFWKGVYETKDDDVFLSIMETNIASAWS